MSNPHELYACIHAREFPAQAMLRLRPGLRGKPLAVLEGEPPTQQVCAVNNRARAMGIIHGMTRVELDTFPDAAILLRSYTEELAAKAAFLECAGTFSPRLEDKSDDSSAMCVIDLAGTEKLFGPPEVLGKNLQARIGTIGITASIAIAGNFEAAICFARAMTGSRVLCVPPRREEAALASLPLSVLALSPEHAEILSLWGIATLGMLAVLPEKELICRLGQEAKRLRQLARGEWPHLFTPLEPAFRLEERIELDSPVELLESLLFVAGTMLEQVIARAVNRVLALATVTLTLTLEGEAPHIRTVRPALPSTDRRLWLKLLQLDLQAHPPNAAVLALQLNAEPGSIGKVQLGLFAPQTPEPGRLDVTLARIRAIVGEDCVGRAVLRDSHRRDDFHMQPFAVPSSQPETTPPRPRAAMRQLRPPVSIAPTLRSRQPECFVFREKRYTVEHAYGPWYAAGDWWSPTLWSLEQWDLVARAPDGQLLCCCVVHDLAQECWQMESLYD